MSVIENIGETSVLVPTGALGAGILREHVRRGMALGADAIAVDAGSTDSGPSYLARGISKYSREAVKADLRVLMEAQKQCDIPLLVGSCGTSGTDDGVEWTAEIVEELAEELGLSPRIACLRSEQTREAVEVLRARGRTRALSPSDEMSAEDVAQCDRIVAVMGVEPYVAALQAGANIVLGGRTSDPAVIAAVPLFRGANAANAWHAGKLAECGGFCTVDPLDGGILARLRHDYFTLEPLSLNNACTPKSVASQMLYESADPIHLIEPGGLLDVRTASYAAVDERIVAVRGAQLHRTAYTMKLEGAGRGPFQTITLVGIRDSAVLARFPDYMAKLRSAIEDRVARLYGSDAADAVSLRPYGYDAVTGTPATSAPAEVGLLFVARAPTQNEATQIAKACNPILFHCPLDRYEELPSYAFAFSPAEIECGPCYEFRLNHVVHTEDPLSLTRAEWRWTHGRSPSHA